VCGFTSGTRFAFEQHLASYSSCKLGVDIKEAIRLANLQALQIEHLQKIAGPKRSDQTHELPSDAHPARLGHGASNQAAAVDSRPDQQVQRGSANLPAASSLAMPPGHNQKELDDLKQALAEALKDKEDMKQRLDLAVSRFDSKLDDASGRRKLR
jgi:hypothetical protein